MSNSCNSHLSLIVQSYQDLNSYFYSNLLIFIYLHYHWQHQVQTRKQTKFQFWNNNGYLKCLNFVYYLLIISYFIIYQISEFFDNAWRFLMLDLFDPQLALMLEDYQDRSNYFFFSSFHFYFSPTLFLTLSNEDKQISEILILKQLNNNI